MAIVGMEVLVIAGILIVFFLAGPKKIPELARALGKAKAEFQNASGNAERLLLKEREES